MNKKNNEQKKIWIAFLLRDKKANEEDKAVLKNNIISKFHKKQSDICYALKNQNQGLYYYFFVKQNYEGQLKSIYQSNKNYFQDFFVHTRITEHQLNEIMRKIQKYNHGYVKFGDFVLINSGRYEKLYGVVLRKNRNDKIEVGLKFCFGNIIQLYESSELTVVGNIFNHIKVLK